MFSGPEGVGSDLRRIVSAGLLRGAGQIGSQCDRLADSLADDAFGSLDLKVGESHVEFCRHLDRVTLPLEAQGDRDFLGDAVKREVAGCFELCSLDAELSSI